MNLFSPLGWLSSSLLQPRHDPWSLRLLVCTAAGVYDRLLEVCQPAEVDLLKVDVLLLDDVIDDVITVVVKHIRCRLGSIYNLRQIFFTTDY